VLYAGGGVAVLAIAAAAFFMLSKPAAQNGTGVTALSQGTTQTPAGTAPSATQAANTSPVVHPSDVQANKPSNAGSPPASNGASNISARLPILLEMSTEDATASKARSEAASLLSKATNLQDSVGLIFVQAQAVGLTGDTVRTCPMLRGILESSKKTIYAPKVSRLLDSAC
jgi:hypothetical protein